MNEVLGVAAGGLTRLHTECNLINAYTVRHGITEFSTYQRGSKVIDYILMDQNVLGCTQAVGYEPFRFHIFSDHRGIFLDLATTQCFCSTIQPFQPIQLRDLSTKRSHQVHPYFQSKQKHLEDHNWFTKIKILQRHMKDGTQDYALAEELYECLITASIHSGSKLKKFPPTPYSPTIARLRNIHCLLRLAVTQFKTSRDLSATILRIKAKLGNAGYDLPKTPELCMQAYLKCTRQLKAAIQEELNTKNLQCQHQDRLIQAHKEAGNTALAKKIRGMKRAETTKRVFP